MDYFYAFLAGFTGKIYDDFKDNNLLKNNILKESLQGSQYILLTLLSHNDFNFALIFYFINVLNAYTNWNAWNFPYEKSLLILYPFLVLISYSTYFIPQIKDFIYILFFMICMAFEPLIITEEFSSRKLFTRLISIIFSVIGIVGGIYYEISPSIIKNSYYALGYTLFSSFFQAHLLLNKPISII